MEKVSGIKSSNKQPAALQNKVGQCNMKLLRDTYDVELETHSRTNLKTFNERNHYAKQAIQTPTVKHHEVTIPHVIYHN